MSEKVVLEHDDLRRTLRRIAHEIAEKNPEPTRLAVVGIHTRGAVLARRLHTFLGELTGTDLPIGDIDISFYRDDVGARTPACRSRSSTTPTSTSTSPSAPSSSSTTSSSPAARSAPRSTRSSTTAAPTASSSPSSVDRGHRELPFRPDYVGKNLPTSREERVNVRLEETDGIDQVTISEPRPAEVACA